MKILLAGTGGGGGNILRSIKALFRQDLALAQKTDARYADRLRRALTTRFLDTNEFSVADVPAEERLLIGAQKTRRLGSRHNPDVAREALEESRTEVTALFRDYSVIVLIGTGGKGTGAGTMFPLAQIAREQRKLVIPIFVRPSFEWHEVDKRRYDHALRVIDQFDSAKIRLIEILNDRGYSQANPASQPVVWDYNAFLLALRSWEGPPGSTLSLEVFRSRYLWHVDVKIHGKEALVTELGDLPALRIDGRTYKLSRKGERDRESAERTFSMWISDDDGRVQLEIRATTDYGDLKMKIVDYQPGTGKRLR